MTGMEVKTVNLREWQDWPYPIPTHYGAGRLRELPAICQRIGMQRPLIVTDNGSRDLPFIEAAQGLLAARNLNCALFHDISPNPRDTDIAAGVRAFKTGRHDGIVAIGGGSGMDGAKAIALSAIGDFPLFDFDYTKPPPDLTGLAQFPPIVTVPTTAGTGAESEATAMITETARMMKWCLAHPELKIAATLLDPELTLALPPQLTAWTGIDALIHAIEAYCVPSFYPLCDGAALEGLRLIWPQLPKAVASPHDIDARSSMLVGSYLAGVAFVKGLGLVHAISHMIGAEFDTHHGLTNAILLPAVLQFNAPAIQDRIKPMAQAMELESDEFDGFYLAVCAMLDCLEIPKTLGEIGVPPGCAPNIAQKASDDCAYATNPRPPTIAGVEQLIEVAITHGR